MLRAYAQLLRIPNVFTAWADVLMGWMVGVWLSHEGTEPRVLVPLLLCSASLYSAGMALNDFFDAEEDARERPHRPIPSGRITRRHAGIVGLGLMLFGLVMAGSGVGASDLKEHYASLKTFFVAILLVASIVAYDGFLKRTLFGPSFMGLCRFLNVLMGMVSHWNSPYFTAMLPASGITLAFVVGLYIAGVTWFARKEATASGHWSLIGATFVMGMSILVALSWPMLWESPAGWELMLHPVLLGLWSLIIAIPVARAIYDPTPQRVQIAVKTCILGLIGLDAILAFGVVGWPGLLILLLLVPALVLGRWVYST